MPTFPTDDCGPFVPEAVCHCCGRRGPGETVEFVDGPLRFVCHRCLERRALLAYREELDR